jgi:hypothetical protein
MQYRDASAVFAARAALRVIPVLASTFGLPSRELNNLQRGAVLRTFRCATAAWAVASFPGRAPDLRSAALAAYRDVDHQTASAPERVAAHAAAAASSDSSFPTYLSAKRSIEIVAGAGHALFEPMLGAFAHDAEILDQRTSPATLALSSTLWPRTPDWAFEGWAELKRALVAANETWEVWTAWYEARLKAGRADEVVEIARATILDETWRQGPRVVNSQIRSVVDSLQGQAPARLEPLADVPSAFGFGWTTAGTITAISGLSNSPTFPLPTSETDHRNRLDACRTIAKDVISALRAQKYNARPEYADALTNYRKRLPTAPGTGNILLADAEARRLRDLWANDLDSIAAGLASLLKIFLEQHIGLRPYYPEIEKFYRDVQTGRIETPLPQDAVEGFVKGVRNNTPTVFDQSVTSALDVTARLAPEPEVTPSSTGEMHPTNNGQPMPPVDPLKELNPRKARDYTIGGVINAVWKTYLEGEKIPKAAKGWKEAGEALQPYVGSILDWLRSFTGS